MGVLEQEKLLLDRERMKQMYVAELEREDITQKKRKDFIYDDEEDQPKP